MRPIIVTTAELTDDANGIAVDQTTGAAANLILNGVLVSGGVATGAEAQIVSIEGAGDNSGITFTITGNDADETEVSETITGAAAGTAKTTGFFKTVNQIATSGAVTGNVEVGWLSADGAVTKSARVNVRESNFKLALFVALSSGASLTYTVEHTETTPEKVHANSFSTDAVWRATTGLTALTATDEGNIAFPVQAVRAKITTQTSGTIEFTTLQAG